MYVQLLTRRRLPATLGVLAITFLLLGCSPLRAGGTREADETATVDRGTITNDSLVGARGERFPAAPTVPEGPLASATRNRLSDVRDSVATGDLNLDALRILEDSEDPRILWYLSDVLRFSRPQTARVIHDVVATLTGVELHDARPNALREHLFAWNLPAYPGYAADKQSLYQLIDPRWDPFFDDIDSDIDWRYVEWGGVLIDDRLDASPGVQCFRCIPAIDDPPVTDATGGSWYPDDALIFGVVINGEARAYPRNMMEVHEMVNDTLGGRRFGMPYCTLCLSAQAYYADNVDGFSPVLRTSGLLARSNKFMYDISTMSAVDTFTGRAISGPLLDAGVTLEMISVVTSTWGEWKNAHPNTTILTRDGGIPGRVYPTDPLRGRDDDGPIFPVGAVDPRLPVQERVLGVIDADGTPVAFPVVPTAFALQQGDEVEYGSIEVTLDGSGLRATVNGDDPGSHEAFWFAWSQFRPETVIWER